MPPKFDRVYLSPGAPVEVSRVADGPELASLRVHLNFRVPAGFTGVPNEHDPERMHRSDELVDTPIDVTLSLGAHSRRLEMRIDLENRARNHRLRVLFPTDLQADVCYADSAFDVIERQIHQVDSHDWREPQLGTYPHSSFVAVQNGRGEKSGGLSVLTAGTPEYEVVDEPRRTIAITLLRAFGRGPGQPHEYVDSQELGSHTFRLALVPFAGTWESTGVLRQSREFGMPLAVAEAERHGGSIRVGQSLLRVEGDGLDVTTVKRCEDRESLLVRLVNLSNVPQAVTLGLPGGVSEVYRLNLAEARQESLPMSADGAVQLTVEPRRIVSVELVR